LKKKTFMIIRTKKIQNITSRGMAGLDTA
jgi:hypothetical protein